MSRFKLNILVTGGAGFIGSHVVDRLLTRGHLVQVIDDLSHGSRRNIDRRAKLHVLDVRSPRAAALVRRLRPDAIIHLAASIDLRRSMNDPSADASVNILGGLNILAAAVAAGTRHLTFASSAAVYGRDPHVPWKETLPPRPSSPYGAAKLSFEHYLGVFRELRGLRSASMRFANVYGPRQSVRGEAGVVARFAGYFMAGKPPVINGDGRQTRDLVYVGDVADAVVTAMEKRLDGVWNVGTGKETSIVSLAGSMRRIGGFVARPVRGPAAANECRRAAMDTRAAKRAGFFCGTELEKGLRMTIEYLRRA